MHRFLTLSIGLTLIGVAGCAGKHGDASRASGDADSASPASAGSQLSDEEYAILSAALGTGKEYVYVPRCGSGQFSVIETETIDPVWIRSDLGAESDFTELDRPTLRPGEAAALDALLTANQLPHRLAPRLNRDLAYRLVPRDELDRMFLRCDHGWRRFYARFPQANRRINVSRPGIAPSGTHAAVYVVWHGYELVGEGCVILLEKKEGKWQISNRVGTWVS
jgi:hypothetical protein